MTTCAYKDGYLAVDSALSDANGSIRHAHKEPIGGKFYMRSWAVNRVGHDCDAILVVTGATESVAGLVKWLEDPHAEPPGKAGNDGPRYVEGMVIDDTGRVWEVNNMGLMLEVRSEFMAIGSGAGEAMGAMAVGASPAEAVRIATKYDDGTAGKITTYKVAEVIEEVPD